METSQKSTPEKIRYAVLALRIQGWIVLVCLAFILIFVLLGAFISVYSFDGSLLTGGFAGLMALVFGGIVGGIFGVLPLIAARKIEQQHDAGRVLGLIIGFLSLLSFPIGTVIGIFVLYGLLGSDAEAWFKK